MRCCNQRLREHLLLNLGGKSAYWTANQSIMNFERVCKAKNQESVLKSIQNANADDGPAPMEADRVEGYKGKGKGGGRGKGSEGKGKKGRGKGRGGGKSKGRGKKGGGKPKKARKASWPAINVSCAFSTAIGAENVPTRWMWTMFNSKMLQVHHPVLAHRNLHRRFQVRLRRIVHPRPKPKDNSNPSTRRQQLDEFSTYLHLQLLLLLSSMEPWFYLKRSGMIFQFFKSDMMRNG